MHLRELDTNLIVVLDALLIDASVTKAAERLGRSPSAISHALANMRAIFDDPLFVRAGQRLVPTTRAEELAPTVHIIVSGIENLLRPSAPFDPKTQERSFVVGCSENFELGLLRRLRNAIQDKAPGIAISRAPIGMEDNLEELRHGKAQFLIIQGDPKEEAADFLWHKLNDEAFVTLARNGHPLAKGTPAKQAFAKHQHILVPPQDGEPEPVRSHFEKNGVVLKDVISASSPLVALFLAIDSEALVTVPRSIADAFTAREKAAAIVQPAPPLSVASYLGWHRSRDRDECHEWVREQIIAAAQTS